MLVKPEDVGLSSARLTRLSARLDAYVGEKRYAGVSMLVGRRGGVALQHCAGVRDLESAAPIRDDTIFRIYSMTKPITAVAALMLHEQGHFLLEDPVSHYLEALGDAHVLVRNDDGRPETRPAARDISVRDLFCHTSGLVYPSSGIGAGGLAELYDRAGIATAGATYDLAELVRRLGEMPLKFDPGSAWNYGVSTDVLGHLVELWSGQPLDRFFAEHIFAPLAMADTAFHVDDARMDRFATCYSLDDDGRMVLYDTAGGNFAAPPALFSGGGGLTSTIWDYQRFAQMLANKGELDGQRLLGRKTVEYMAANHIPGELAALAQDSFSETTNDGIGFGLGVAVVVDAVRNQVLTSEGQFYWGGLASTAFWIDPAEELYAIFMTQLVPSSSYPTRRELRTLVYQALID